MQDNNHSHQAMNGSEEGEIYCGYRLQLPLSTLKPQFITPFLSIFSILTFTSTFLNLLVFTLLVKNRQMRQKRHIKLLLCLSVSDLLVGSLVSPTSMAQIMVGSGSAQCVVNRIAGGVQILMATANLIITTISFDRYILIVHDNSYYDIITSKRFSCILAMPWVASFFLVLLAIFSRTSFMWCQLVLTISTYICFVSSYWKIQAHLSQHELYWAHPTHTNIRRRRNKRTTHIMAAIIIATLSCSALASLSLVVYLLDFYGIGGIEWLKTWRQFYLGVIGNILLQSNSTFNPILYICISKEFKKMLLKTLRPKKHKVKSARNTRITIASQGPATLFSYSSVIKGDAKMVSMQGRINEHFEEEEGCTSTISGGKDFTGLSDCLNMSNLNNSHLRDDITNQAYSTMETKL